MKLEAFTVGQRYFQTHVFYGGCPVEESGVDRFSSREEAEEDGQIIADNYDQEWQKRNPDQMEVVVREYEVLAVEDDGSFGSACTVD